MTEEKTNQKVKVYSTPVCPFCTTLKKFLKDHNVEFENINVAEDKEAAKEMIEKSGQMGVPVLEVGKEIVIGFDRDKIKELLKLE
jgi:glutaredoxin-like YruB-family protein